MSAIGTRAGIRWILLACILALAAWFRVTAIENTVIDDPIRADAAEHYMSAYNLMVNGVYTKSPARLQDPGALIYPDSYRYPGLPLVIAAFIGDWPDHAKIIHHVQMVNALAGVATVALAFVAASIALPVWAALVVALLTAISPHLVSFTVYMLTEPIASLLIALLILVAASSLRKKSGSTAGWGAFAGIGIVIGLLTLYRPIYIALAVAIVPALPRRANPRRAIIGVLLGTALVVGPWFARNAIVNAGSDSSLIATTMIDGANPDYTLNGDPATFPYPRLSDPAGLRATRDARSAIEEIGRRFAADPLAMAYWYGIGKMVYLWQWSNIDGDGDVFIYPVTETPFETHRTFGIVHAAMKALHWVLVLLGAAGAVAVWLPAAKPLLAARGLIVLRAASVILIYTTLALIPFVMVTRYAVPTFPALYLLAMVPVVLGLAQVSRRRARGP